MSNQRAFDLQRGVIDMETGEFPVTTFTNGEASDKHIIDIRTLTTPERVPMFFNHNADPVEQPGSLTNPHKRGKMTLLGRAMVKRTARIEMGGDGQLADIRRDVALRISNGDITSMSGRWAEGFKATPRAALAKSHFAFRAEESGGFSTPLFIENAIELESSIVGIGADQAALIGRAQDTESPQHVRDFYRALTEGDELTREEALRCLSEEAAQIEGLRQIETSSGPFYVPADVFGVWGQSVEISDTLSTPKNQEPFRTEVAERGLLVQVSDEVRDTMATEEQEAAMRELVFGETSELGRKLDAEMTTPAEPAPEASREEAAPTAEPPENRSDTTPERPSSEDFDVFAYMKQAAENTDKLIRQDQERVLYDLHGTVTEDG